MPAGFRIGLADKLFLCSFLPFPLSGGFLPLYAKKKTPAFLQRPSGSSFIFLSLRFPLSPGTAV